MRRRSRTNSAPRHDPTPASRLPDSASSDARTGSDVSLTRGYGHDDGRIEGHGEGSGVSDPMRRRWGRSAQDDSRPRRQRTHSGMAVGTASPPASQRGSDATPE